MPLPSRVTLRRMQEDDIPMLLAMESDPEVMRYSTGVKPADEARRQELLAWLREPLTRLGHWAITVDGAAVGWVSLVPLAGTDSIQLAYRLQRAAWGKGYASQAAKQLCEYAWRETEVSELVAVVWPDNQAPYVSWKSSGLRSGRANATTTAKPSSIHCRVLPLDPTDSRSLDPRPPARHSCRYTP